MKLAIAIFLSIGFGSLYTLFRKYQNVAHLEQQNKQFNQPLLQAFFIFIGMSTIVFFKPLIQKEEEDQHKKKENLWIYLLPSFFDVLGTVSDTAGLFYTSVSVSQMLKGSVLLFTYVITLLRGKVLSKEQHRCMFFVLFALFIIGYSNISSQEERYQSNPQFGNFLIILSQLLFAIMFLSEEYITQNYNVQISNAILWQGIWGTIMTGFAIVFFSIVSSSVIKCQIIQSTQLIYQNTNLLVAVVMTALCIGPFNYFGLYITKNTSALERCLVCTGRMVIVWIGSLCCSWQSFSIIQFVGYVVLTLGIYEFNKANLKSNQITIEEIELQKLTATD